MNFYMPKFTLLTFFIEKPISIFLIAPPIMIAPAVDFYGAVTILVVLFLSDFVTGVLASYFDWKKDENKKERWFFGKGEGFSSDKFKKMFVKGIVYLAFPYFLLKFQEVFMIKNVKYETLSTAEFDLATLCILIFCMIEGFSIVHENLPRCGINIFSIIKKMLGMYKETKNELES